MLADTCVGKDMSKIVIHSKLERINCKRALARNRRTIVTRIDDWKPLASQPRLHRDDVETFRKSMDQALGEYRHSAIAIAGLFGSEESNTISTEFARSVSNQLNLTTMVINVEKSLTENASGLRAVNRLWQKPEVKNRQFNYWTLPDLTGFEEKNDVLEMLYWMRSKNDLTVFSFNTLADVFSQKFLVRALDGLVLVNSGNQSDINIMGKSIQTLQQEGIGIIGQVKNFASDNSLVRL